jgi:hypothetical protein
LTDEVRRLGHRSRKRDLNSSSLRTIRNKALQTFLCKTVFISLGYLEDTINRWVQRTIIIHHTADRANS